MKNATWGILAHVDAGKTTLSESILFHTGAIISTGRVDKGDTFLDTDTIEKERGITIFSKQAKATLGDFDMTFLDTPGHVDFSAEMERTLSVLDGAILVISGADGVQSHTRTLWKLLASYKVPVIVFVNKMDQPGTDKAKLIKDLQNGLSGECIDFTDFSLDDESFCENVATCDESLMERYLETGSLSETDLVDLFYERKLFPVWFGSALKDEGVEELLSGLKLFVRDLYANKVSDEFAARCFKVSHDDKGERLSYLKVTSGTLKVKDIIEDEKVHSIRMYSGAKFTTVNEVVAGQVCAVCGLTTTMAGQGIGASKDLVKSLLMPVLSYNLILPEDVEVAVAYPKLMLIAEEEPDLTLEYDEDNKLISLKLMGEVQTEILKRKIKDRFGYEVSYGESRIVYKETIEAGPIEGVGHFEPLRHYAEVHLLLEPAEPGEGLIFDTDCSEDILDKNWQRLIMTHLRERVHRGVLTGSAITDMKITVVSGRAHPKHTEGGDFRQATYRAIRQGLMQAKSVLLEPYFEFYLSLPATYVGRAMTDLERMHASDFSPEIVGDEAVLHGIAPVSLIQGYGADVIAYTSGLGHLTLNLWGYGKCHNADEVIEARGYDPSRDLRNTPDSVFCEHGSGVVVPWNEVKARMHMPSVLTPTKELTDEQIRLRAKRAVAPVESGFIGYEEVEKIINSTTGNKGKEFTPHKGINYKVRRAAMDIKSPAASDNYEYKPKQQKPKYLLVDGYNVIFAWDELAKLARVNIDGARDALIDVLCNYQAMEGVEVIAVFDAYKLKAHGEEFLDVNNIHVVYTKTAMTADRYIERFSHQHASHYDVTVVTSDGAEQIIVRGEGAFVLSSRDFYEEVKRKTSEFNQKFDVK